LKAGSFGTISASYALAQKTSDLETSISLSRLKSDGFSAVEESLKNPNPKPDGFESVSLSASIKYQISENASLGATFLSQDDKSGFDGFNLTDAENIRKRKQIGGSVFAEFFTGSVVNKIQISGYRIERELKNVGFSDNLYDGSRSTLSYRGYVETNPSTTLVWGAETTKENYETDFSEGSGRSNSIYGQILWSPLDKLNLDSTFRLDNSSGFGTFTTGRLAAAYQLNDVITLRGAVGSGFRAPSLEERFAEYDFRDPDPIFPSTYYFQGNPNVEPETSKSFEFGLEAELKNGMIFSGTLFRLETDNMIRGCGEREAVECDRVLPQNVTASYENRKGISNNSGVELAASIPINASLLLDANYTYIDAKNPEGIRLGRTPRHEMGVSVSAELTDRLSGVLSIQHVADRLDRDGEQPLEDYTVTNLNLSYTLTDKASLTFLVENLFDEQYQQVAGYGTSDRAFYVGLSSRF
jgi:vitamin B12 transporter